MQRIEKGSCDGIFLSSVLQQGVFVEFLPGETVASFIRRVLSLDAEGVQREVQTLILNNGCVDDPETTELVSGDTLVLSGAMPGLVGAMLRSDSPIKAMRKSMSSGEDRRLVLEGRLLRLKLFNTVLSDHKNDLLKLGFFIEDET
ncbi:MAG: hypothetical protein PQJ58_07285 [Spirochaetales bacterium]|nr:hypothetical protein [Spirochaetales bacterium]